MIKSLKRVCIASVLMFISSTMYSQTGDIVETEARGTGLKREDALQDAMRNAIGQAVGVALSSETKVENFMVISDAIASKTTGYIKSYQVIKEVPFPDRYEVNIRASVTTAPMKADFSMLARAVGGVRFMVVYDPRTVQDDQVPYYDLAVDKMNEYLSSKNYRYIERKRFESLRSEAFKILESDKSEISYVQRLGMMSDAQFIISLNNLMLDARSEQFDTRTSTKVSIQAKAYDNCTAEGLGTVVFESGRNSSSDANSTIRTGISDAISKNADQLIGRFVSYIGDWLNNGTPFELRFYNVGTYRDFRDLRTKMKELSEFGGDMEIVSVENYTKLNCTFRKKPDELADKVLDIADQIPGFKEKVLDVKLIYGRQINFAPRNVVVPELQQAQNQITNGANLNGNSGGNKQNTGATSTQNNTSRPTGNTSNPANTGGRPAGTTGTTTTTLKKPGTTGTTSGTSGKSNSTSGMKPVLSKPSTTKTNK